MTAPILIHVKSYYKIAFFLKLLERLGEIKKILINTSYFSSECTLQMFILFYLFGCHYLNFLGGIRI